MLCRRCEDLFCGLKAAKKGSRKEILYHHDTRRFSTGSCQDCNVCKFFRSNNYYQGQISKITLAKETSTNYILVADVQDPKNPGKERNGMLYQVTQVDLHHDRSRFGINEQTTSTGSVACFALARHWIQSCQRNHEKCRQRQPAARQGWNPTRLVIIGKDGAGSKLCDGNLIGRPIQYATLSHCWGKQFKPTVLTLENKATFQEGLPDTSLPRTFKDAIVAARMLGLDYIWIDSLCIIQNSDDDWMNEVSQMGKVYERSTVTITATSSEDDGGGCFFSRNTQDTFPTRISVEPINGCSRRQKLTGASQTIFDLDIPIKEHWKYDVEMAPVNARGWVLQERFLSPRLLHFSKRQLYWECNQMLASEAYPSGFCIIGPGQYLEFSPWHGRLRSDLALPLPLDLRGLFRETFIETWMNIIEHYTTRDISKKRDKLPAISALARKVYALRSSDYLAGIWRKDLVYELGWMSFSCNSPSETSEESSIAQSDDRIHYSNSYTSKPLHRAPSWSWASVDGQVTYPYGEYNISSASNHSLLEYVNHRIKLRKNADPYGEITEGHLTVIAQTIEVTLKQYPEFEAGRSTVHQMQISVIGHIVAAQTNVCLDELNGWSYPDSYEGLAMPVLLSLSRSGELFLTCLLLEKEHDSYKRIGALNLRAKRWDLESDYGLQEIVCRLGKIEWDVKPGIHFMRDPSQLQQIKIV